MSKKEIDNLGFIRRGVVMVGLEVLLELLERIGFVIACVFVTLVGMALALGVFWWLT